MKLYYFSRLLLKTADSARRKPCTEAVASRESGVGDDLQAASHRISNADTGAADLYDPRIARLAQSQPAAVHQAERTQ